MADGVGTGLFQTQHYLIDHALVVAMQPEVIAHALPGARKAHGVEASRKARRGSQMSWG